MYQVSVRQHFDAAHYLRGYQGRCERVHGHRYEVVVSIKTEKLDDIGLAFDFVQLKGHLKEILSRFDHVLLNEVAPFDNINPSAENIATTIYNELRQKLDRAPVSLASIEVWESPDSRITYVP